MKYDKMMSYCITEINSSKIQSGPVRCFVAHGSYFKYTFKMTPEGEERGRRSRQMALCKISLEPSDLFQSLLWIGSWGRQEKGCPFPCEASSASSFSSLLMGLIFQPLWYGFSRELSLLDLLCYFMLQRSFLCKLSAARNSVKNLGSVMQQNWHQNLAYWAVKVGITGTVINVGPSLQRAWNNSWDKQLL